MLCCVFALHLLTSFSLGKGILSRIHFRVTFQNAKHINLMNALWKSSAPKKPHCFMCWPLAVWRKYLETQKRSLLLKHILGKRKKYIKKFVVSTDWGKATYLKIASVQCEGLVEVITCDFPSFQKPWCLLNKLKSVTCRMIKTVKQDSASLT